MVGYMPQHSCPKQIKTFGPQAVQGSGVSLNIPIATGSMPASDARGVFIAAAIKLLASGYHEHVQLPPSSTDDGTTMSDADVHANHLDGQDGKGLFAAGVIALPFGLRYDSFMMMKRLFSATPFVSGMCFFLGCTSLTSLPLQPEAPEVLLVNITPLDTTIFEHRLKVDLRVRNPNDFDLKVTGLDFTLHLNEQRLARGLTNKASTIPRLGDSVVSVETTTSTLDVLRQFLNFRQKQEVTYQVDGILHIQGARLPFDNKGVLIDLNQLPGSSNGS
jgi:LEA14-like dessication related protein